MCRARHGKGGIIAHYCAISPSQPPFIAYNTAQYIFPTTPFISFLIAIKYWQYLVRAKKQYLVKAKLSPAQWGTGRGVEEFRWGAESASMLSCCHTLHRVLVPPNLSIHTYTNLPSQYTSPFTASRLRRGCELSHRETQYAARDGGYAVLLGKPC